MKIQINLSIALQKIQLWRKFRFLNPKKTAFVVMSEDDEQLFTCSCLQQRQTCSANRTMAASGCIWNFILLESPNHTFIFLTNFANHMYEVAAHKPYLWRESEKINEETKKLSKGDFFWRGCPFRQKAATYHVMMYCMCSFLSVTLVCPPIGPPGTVLSGKQSTTVKQLDHIYLFVEQNEFYIESVNLV